MTLENKIRILAGSMVLISFVQGRYVNSAWAWLYVFVGVNLIQSAFTHFCPAEIILKKCTKS